jgi:hypothetical protein
MPAELARKVAAIRAAHAHLPVPPQAGRSIAIRRG